MVRFMKNKYIIKSNSFTFLNDKIKELSKDYKEVETFSLVDDSIDDVIESMQHFGLFSENKCIVVKNVKYFAGNFAYEEECNKLKSALSNLDDETMVIFINDEVLKSKKIVKDLIASGVTFIDLTGGNEEETLEYMNSYFKNLNITIEKNALQEIYKNSSNNIDITINEVLRLSNLSSNITTDMVNNYTHKNDEDVTFSFSNATIAKDFDLAFKYLDIMLKNGAEPINIVALLANSFTNIYMVKSAASDGLSDEEIAKLFGYTNPKRVGVLKRNGKIYTLDQLKDIIISLSELDLKIKSGYNQIYAIKEFLLNL